MTLNFAVNNQALSLNRAQQNLKLVADSKNYLVTKFMFMSSEWKKGELVYALFSYDGRIYKQELGIEEELNPNECYVPEWVIRAPGFKVSLVGGDRITTNEVEVKLLPSAYTSDPDQPPPPEGGGSIDSEELADMLWEELGYKEDTQ